MVYVSRLEVTVFSPTRLDLSWANEGGTPTLTQIERSLDNVTWAPLILLYFAPIAYSDASCSPGTSYWYRIALYDPIGGWGPYCNAECAMTTTPMGTTTPVDVVVPVESFAAVLTLGTVGVYGLSPADVAMPVEAFTKVLTLGTTNLFPIIQDFVTPVESLVVYRGLVRTLSFEDITIPIENVAGVPAAIILRRVLSEPFYLLGLPNETITFLKWVDYLAAGEELLLVARADNHLYLFTTSNPAGSWETRDIDFGFPGIEKTLDEIRAWGVPTTPITLTVAVSIDSGETWVWNESITLSRSRSGIVFPWLTGEKFRIRFGAPGLQLSGYHASAVPRSREGLRP